MSLESDVLYWDNRNWDAISKENQQIAQTFEKAKKVYSDAVKAGIIESDNPELDFSFSTKPWKRRVFGINEIIRALVLIHVIEEDQKEEITIQLTNVLDALNPTKEAYYLTFR